MFCVINAKVNTLTERFLRDEKILLLRSSVVYLSLNTVENKKSATKILVYSCVIDISQMDVIFSATFITSGLERLTKGASRVLLAF